MSRQQRRETERKLNKHAKNVNKFTTQQMATIEEIVRYGTEQRATEIVEERVQEIIFTIDRCITAYFHLRFADMSTMEIVKEQSILSELLDEDSEKIENLLNECGGNKKMAKKKLEKFETEVRKMCNELLDNKVKQAEAIVILQDKFTVLSKTMLINKFKEVKAEREPKEEDPEIVAAAEYIFGEDEKKPVDTEKDKQERPKQATEEKKEVTRVNTPNEVEKPVQAKSKLKRIGVLFQGEYGDYVKTPEGVTVADKLYKNVESVDEEAKDIVEKNQALIENFESTIDELNTKIMNCKETVSNVKALTNEIKAVMEMA